MYIYIYIRERGGDIGAMLPRFAWAACHGGLVGRLAWDGMIGAICLGRLAFGRPIMSFLVAGCAGQGAGQGAGQSAWHGKASRWAGPGAWQGAGQGAGQRRAGQGAGHGAALVFRFTSSIWKYVVCVCVYV